MVGTFANPQEEGSMAVFTTREAAEEFVRGDPFVLNGVVSNWDIRGWNEVLAPSPEAGETASSERTSEGTGSTPSLPRPSPPS